MECPALTGYKSRHPRPGPRASRLPRPKKRGGRKTSPRRSSSGAARKSRSRAAKPPAFCRRFGARIGGATASGELRLAASRVGAAGVDAAPLQPSESAVSGESPGRLKLTSAPCRSCRAEV